MSRLTSALLLAVLSLLTAPAVLAQSYVPQFPAFTASSCPPGQQFVSVGSLDTYNSTLFPENQQGTQLGTYWNPYYQYVYTTPFTNTAFGAVLTQLQVNLLDNSLLPTPVYFRLALYLFQTAEKKINGYNEATLIGQTDEITLYPSKDQILYANLMQPVTLLSEGDYGIGIYSNLPFYIAGGPYQTGFSAEPQFYYETEGYNDYSSPQALLMYPGDRRHPVAAVGCLDPNMFNNASQTVFAFCGLIETYQRMKPSPPNINPRTYYSNSASLTNVTRYSGVIAVDNSATVPTSYGQGQRIAFMEGEVQTSTNAGAEYYPPLGLRSDVFTYRPNHPRFPTANDLLYPAMSIPIDTNGIVVSTLRNQTRLYYTNVSRDQTIGQQGQNGVTTATYFSSFLIFPKSALDSVITSCNIPLGYDYIQDGLSCPSGSAPVSFGDVDLDDLDPLEEDEVFDYLPPNLISFRRFTVYTPATVAYQLSYYSYSNPEAIVHMRLGLFATTARYVDSASAEPIYNLLAMTNEIELVNADDTLVIANLSQPIPLTQGATYAIGVWADALIYGPEARWGVDSAGLRIPYNFIDQYGSFPKSVHSLGGQTGTQPMGVNACAAGQSIVFIDVCFTFAEYVFLGGWFLEKRFYSGSVQALSTPYMNDFGTYHILVAGNGTYIQTYTPVNGPACARPNEEDCDWPLTPEQLKQPRPVALYINGSWNLNNFQLQSPDYLYVQSNMQPGLKLDGDGIQVIVNIDQYEENVVYAVIINSYKPRGSPTYYYRESVEYDYQDAYSQVPNSAAVFNILQTPQDALACDFDYTPWSLTSPPNQGLETNCDGLAIIQSTYGDNKVGDYAIHREGSTVQRNFVYTANFSATIGAVLNQVSIDVLNNSGWIPCVTATVGIYNSSGSLLTSTSVLFLQVLDQMVVVNLLPTLLNYTGLYYIGFIVDTNFNVAHSSRQQETSPSMFWDGTGLPDQFVGTQRSTVPPITAYGCVPASHYFCGTFQYYQGDDYSPVTYDYLYQGLLLLEDLSYTNDYGTWSPVQYGVGHLTVLARIALSPLNYRLYFTDILLANPGNQTSNYVYTSSRNGARLDGVGLNFLTDDDFGPSFSLIYNSTTRRYQDTTQAQLGAELLQELELGLIDRSVGVPQCSFLDLPPVVFPNSSLHNSTQCGSTAAVMWGDDVANDEFYYNEGLWSNAFYLITLSPFNTGNDYSSIQQLGLALLQNANVFAHIKMALYDSNNTLMGITNEVAVDNSRDDVLYFTLQKPVTLRPASVYYAAYWADVSLYTPAGSDPTALCYYGVQYGYDLDPWPITIGSEEAEFYNCNPLPVAALGCVTGAIPPPPQEVCYLVYPSSSSGGIAPPPPQSTGVSPQSTAAPPTLPPSVVTSTPAVGSSSVPMPPTGSPTAPVVWSSTSTPPPAPDVEVEKEGVSVGSLIVAILLTMALTALATVFAMRMFQAGKCPYFSRSSSDDGGAILGGGDTNSSTRYSSMRD